MQTAPLAIVGERRSQVDLLLGVIHRLAHDDGEAIVDTIWMPLEGYGNRTAVECLCELASDLGATDAELEAVIQ